jgi:hypothetical protein
MYTATIGTGIITLGAAVPPFLSFAAAGIANGDIVSYSILDGANSEIGTGTYTAAGTTLTRTVTKSTNANAAISLSGGAQVMLAARAEDIANLGQPNTFTDATNSTTPATGSIVLAGGMGVAKDLHVGGTLGQFGPGTGTAIVVVNGGNTNANDGAAVAFQNNGVNGSAIGDRSVLIGGAFNNALTLVSGTGTVRTPNNMTIESGTLSSSFTTGALVVTGGVGISNNMYAGGIGSFGSNNPASTQALECNIAAGSVNGTSIVIFRLAGAFIADIGYNSGTGGVLYNVTSDYRLKRDYTPISDALASLSELKPYDGYYTNGDGTKAQFLIAHEAQLVVPWAVSGQKDEMTKDGEPKYQGIDYSQLVPLLIASIQELSARLDALTKAK